MKLFIYTSLFFIVVILAGCAVEYSYYHSTADIPKYSRSVLTEAKLIEWPSDATRNFGVVVATDLHATNPEPLHYALFVPAKQGVAVTKMDELVIGYASPIQKEDLKYLAAMIDGLLGEWNKNSSTLNGTFYEFNYAPEHEIIKLSENVVKWYPSVYFGFQDTEDGSVGVLIVGPEYGYGHKYEFTDMKELSTFQTVLSNAIREIEVREKNKK